MTNKVLELYGVSEEANPRGGWSALIRRQMCPFTQDKCMKARKSAPDVTIGTCVVQYGSEGQSIAICPQRFLQRRQVFSDVIHLLHRHVPGNEFHIVREVTIPGGSVDYFLVSAKGRRVLDFVGVEFQTLDTTGTVWPARAAFLRRVGAAGRVRVASKPFGMNWKMTAKTILMQLHHKTQTFEHLSKHLVLVLQDCLLDYMKNEFHFAHVGPAAEADTVHFHAYEMLCRPGALDLQLALRLSTDARGIDKCLGLHAEPEVEWSALARQLEAKMSDATLWAPGGSLAPRPRARRSTRRTF